MNRRLVVGIALGLAFASMGPLLADVAEQSGRRLEAPPGTNHVRSEVRHAMRIYGEADRGTGWMEFLISAWFQDQRIVADGRPYSDQLVDGRVTLFRRTCLGIHGCFQDVWTATIRDRSAFIVDPPTGMARLSVQLEGSGPPCNLEVAGVHPVKLGIGGTFYTPYRGLGAVETANSVTAIASGSCIGGAGSAATADGQLWKRMETTPSQLVEPQPGTIVSIAGVPAPGYEGDGGPARWAWLSHPSDVAVSEEGTIYIVEQPTRRIRRIDPDGTIHTHASVSADSITLLPDGSLLASNWHGSVVRVTESGSTTSFAGGGASLGDGGQATNASLNFPEGIASDRTGRVYIADSGNNRVRVVQPDGTIHTFAGDGTCSSPSENELATQSTVCGPTDVTVAQDGSVYIVEQYQRRVRRVSPDGRIRTVIAPNNIEVTVPLAGGTFRGDLEPEDVGAAPDGTVYVSFGTNIARLAPDGSLEPIAGKGTCDYEGDGGPALLAGICGATGISFDSQGRMYFADLWHHAIRRIDLAAR